MLDNDDQPFFCFAEDHWEALDRCRLKAASLRSRVNEEMVLDRFETNVGSAFRDSVNLSGFRS